MVIFYHLFVTRPLAIAVQASLAEVTVPRRSFAAILDWIAQLAIPPPCVAGGHG